MTIDEIEKLLRLNKWCRERINRHHFIIECIGSKYLNRNLGENGIKSLVDEYNTIVRYIQMIQKENTELRGDDYSDGKVLKEQKVISLGYSMGFNEDLKILKNL